MRNTKHRNVSCLHEHVNIFFKEKHVLFKYQKQIVN